MRQEKQHLDEGPSRNLGAAMVLFFLGLTTPPAPGQASDFQPPAGAVLVGQFTIGGCVTVCETLAMCDEADINENNGDCWLQLDETHADFVSLVKACPKPNVRRFNAEMSDGIWRLTCASAVTDEKAQRNAGDIEDLPDFEPF